MRDSLVFGAESDAVRKKCTAEGNSLTFKKAREITLAEEATRLQMKAMGNPQDQSEVNSLQNTRDKRQRKGKTHSYKTNKKPNDDKSAHTQHHTSNKCGRCGNAPHKKGQKCPAIDSECYGCHNIGHFQHMCYSTKKKSVRTLDDNDNYDERVFLGTLVTENYENENSKRESIFQLSENRDRVMTELQFTTNPYHKRTTPVVCRIDTGVELNVISKKDFECLFPERERKLEKPSCKITSYGGHGIANLGKCQCMHITRVKLRKYLLMSLKYQALL